MNVLKKILMGFGGLFLLLVLLIIFLGGQSSSFKKDYSPFATSFLSDFSTDWDRSSVIERMSNTLIEQTSSQEVENVFQQFRSLGQLKSIGTIEIENYTTHTDFGEEAVFTISAKHEAGHALWKMGINVKDKNVKVTGLRLVSFDGEPFESEKAVTTSA